jgi:superfamily II DNA or RNA helicase
VSELFLGLIGELYNAWAGPERLRLALTKERREGSGLPKHLIEIEQATEMGLFAQDGTSGSSAELLARYEDFPELNRHFTFPFFASKPSPYYIAVRSQGDIGRSGFSLQAEFRSGATPVSCQRWGYFLQRRNKQEIFHCNDEAYALLDAIERFHKLPPPERTETACYELVASVKGFSLDAGAMLDDLLRQTAIILPPAFGIRVAEVGDAVSIFPTCHGIPDGELEKGFLASHRNSGVLHVTLPGGRRAKVVLTKDQQEVMQRMRNAQRVTGTAGREIKQHPERIFEGLMDAVDFGERVIGIGEFQPAVVPRPTFLGTGIFDPAPGEPIGGSVGAAPTGGSDGFKPVTLQIPNAEGGELISIQLQTAMERDELRKLVREALQTGHSAISFRGRSLKVTDQLEAILLNPPQRPGEDPQVTNTSRYILIQSNEEGETAMGADVLPAATALRYCAKRAEVPVSLAPGVELKPHQLGGLRWLQNCYRHVSDHRRGALLADDMGLGKTLQALTFVAWLIEQGVLSDSKATAEAAPWRPILIVQPLILLENQTWRKEMQQYFFNQGSVFEPILELYGNAIKRMRTPGTNGAELTAEVPVLDPARLRQYRVVLTNYETIRNHPYSFAQLYQGRGLWSAVITDEAQEFKTPSTKISNALKGIESEFFLACTGTPVETRLLDVWNLLDTAQKGLLGTASDFTKRYEKPINTGEDYAALNLLKAELRVGEPNAFLMRREKSSGILKDLPPRTFQTIRVAMTEDEVAAHSALLSGTNVKMQGQAFQILHGLGQLSHHLRIRGDDWENQSTAQLLAEGPKLKAIIDQLRQIRQKGEKAIIFCRYIAPQQLLKRVLYDELRINVNILNGSTARTYGSKQPTATAKLTRERIVDDFRSAPGFQVLILSPEVAGIGLTLTEANHVFHYGRWWNPAVEAQANDRVYRIGQKRPVTVYLPVSYDPTGRLARTFDECLHDLLERRSVLARDFLAPMPDEGQNQAELLATLQGEQTGESPALTIETVDRMSERDFEALAGWLWEAEGDRTVLMPLTRDAGVDVIARQGMTYKFIQVKHSRSGNDVPESAIDQVLAGANFYQQHIHGSFQMIVFSNARGTGALLERAMRSGGVQLVLRPQLEALLRQHQPTMAQVVMSAAKRVNSSLDGVRYITDSRTG